MERRTKRMRGYTRLSSKHQVTIPGGVLTELGLRAGDVLHVETSEGRIVLRPEEDPVTRRLRALDEASGSLTGVYGPEYLKRLRSEWR